MLSCYGSKGMRRAVSADFDSAARRSEHGRRMRVRRITGSIQTATAVFAAILLYVFVGVLGSEQVDNLTILASSVLLLWFAGSGPADWLAEQIEAWLSSPIRSREAQSHWSSDPAHR